MAGNEHVGTGNKRIHIWVKGTVQGVFFRQYTLSRALELGLRGWVKNLRDGRVEIVCEGMKDRLLTMLDWSGTGPPGAIVEGVDVTWEEYTGGFKTFEIKYH